MFFLCIGICLFLVVVLGWLVFVDFWFSCCLFTCFSVMLRYLYKCMRSFYAYKVNVKVGRKYKYESWTKV